MNEQSPRPPGVPGARTMAASEVLNTFALLAQEEARGDHQAEDLVFLTYNADLGFLEARLLGVCRAAGARVTLIADGAVWAPDPWGVFRAGRSYHVGLTSTRGAFHPKVMVLAGRKRALAAVGSGNLTMGGWQYNAELLTLFSGTTTTMPSAFTDLSRMLTALADSDTVDRLSANALRRVVNRIEALSQHAGAMDTGHRVAASWQGALIDRLPVGPVAEVLASAPFHDPGSVALRKVLDRLQPASVQVAIQSGWTHVDAAALRRALEGYRDATGAAVTVVADRESPGERGSRYRHGKLIEWITEDGRRWAMTGSPNLSTAALLRSVAGGGNHEVAVVGPVSESLFPGAEPLDWAEVQTVQPDGPGAEETDGETAGRGAPMLAAAFRHDSGLQLTAARAGQFPARVQVSLRTASPDAWVEVGELAAGAAEATMPPPPGEITVPAGSRVRLVWAFTSGAASAAPVAKGAPHDTTREVSDLVTGRPVFVTDIEAVQRRPIPTKNLTRAQRATPADVLGGDLSWLRSLAGDLSALGQDLATVHGPRGNATGDDDQDAHAEQDRGGRDGDAPDPWLWLQDDTVRSHGSALATYALALPRLPEDQAAVGWADLLVDDAEAGLEADSADSAEAALVAAEPSSGEDGGQADVAMAEATLAVPDSAPVDHSGDPEKVRGARRKWAVRAAALAPRVTIPSRLLILRLTLVFWSAGDWDDHGEPLGLVRALLASLDRTQTPPEMEQRIGSLAAVAFTMIRDRADVTVHDATTLAYRQLSDAYAHMLVAADEDLIDVYAQGIRTPHETPLTVEHVIDTIAVLTQQDPLADLVARLEREGHEVDRPAERLVCVRGRFTNPVHIALDAVGAAEDTAKFGVWAIAPSGSWALVAWNRPDLVTITASSTASAERASDQPRMRWRHQHLNGLVGPAAVAAMTRRHGPQTPFDVASIPKHSATAEARAVLAAINIDDPRPPE